MAAFQLCLVSGTAQLGREAAIGELTWAQVDTRPGRIAPESRGYGQGTQPLYQGGE
jgi:hypothetical protein